MKRVILLLLLTSWHPLLAEELPIYESLRGVHIGPVFLTPEQRRWLDHQRRLPPETNSATSSAEENKPEEKKRQPAGYIISSRGVLQKWQDTDFKAASASSITAIRFPDDVEITRHPTPRERDEAGK